MPRTYQRDVMSLLRRAGDNKIDGKPYSHLLAKFVIAYNNYASKKPGWRKITRAVAYQMMDRYIADQYGI